MSEKFARSLTWDVMPDGKDVLIVGWADGTESVYEVITKDDGLFTIADINIDSDQEPGPNRGDSL